MYDVLLKIKIGLAKGAHFAEPGAQYGKVPYQTGTYHDHRGYHNKKAKSRLRGRLGKVIHGIWGPGTLVSDYPVPPHSGQSQYEWCFPPKRLHTGHSH